MTKQRNHHTTDLPLHFWNEELSRAKKYKEATQKRKTQKQVENEMETLKKKSSIGRLRIEP